jgi:imidazolonepropionase-like amidohydrolase
MQETSYFAGWLIDGTGTPAQRDILIRMENGLILSLERANPAELKGLGFAVETYPTCTILPGLIDCHVHLSMSGKIDHKLRFRQLLYEFAQNSPLICERVEKSLRFGIVALRDGGDIGGHTLTYIRQNCPSRVRVKCAGKGWRAPGRYGKIIGRSPRNGSTLAESIKANRDVIDHIKIINSGMNSLNEFGRETTPQFNRDELDAAFRDARNLGRKTMVHANGKLPVQCAVEAGCDSIEHGFFMGEDNMKRMADRQVFWVPTAFTMKAMRAHLPAGSVQEAAASRMLEAQLEQMGRARKLGVRLAAGTDAGSFGVRHGAALAEELKLMIEAGFSVEEAIGCATSGGARLLGLDHELGRLGRGMPANFIIVDGPPSGLPDSLGEVKVVCVKGEKIAF